MNLKEFVAAVRRYRITFVLVIAVVLYLGSASILLSPAGFVSSMQLMVSIEGSTTANAYQNDDVVEGRINSYIPLLTSGVVTKRVVDTLGLPLTAPELATKINATRVPPRTAIIDVAVTDESPERARVIARTLAREFINYTEALEMPTGEDSHKVNTTVVTAASEAHQNRSGRLLLAVLAGLAALLMGGVAVWIRSRTDPFARTADPTGGVEDQGRELVLTSTVGEVDTPPIGSNFNRAVELADMHPTVPNACNQGAETVDDEPVTEGSSSTEANPDGAGDKPENNNTESNNDELVDIVNVPMNELPASESGADEIPDGAAVSLPAADANPAVPPELIDRLRSEDEYVVVAAAPLLPVIEGSILSEVADHVLLLLSIGETTRRDLHRGVEELRALGVPPTVAVLVGKPTMASKSDESSGEKNTQSDHSDEGSKLA